MGRIELNGHNTAAEAGIEPAYGAPVRTVKQVNAMLQQVLGMHLPATFAVQGEISNYRVYDRGHAFFTLKEPGAELPCVCWRDGLARLKFKPKDGMAVVARGAIKLYEPQGKVQLYVEALFPQGMGELELAFRQLCEKLRTEGLFEPERKRPIPRLPQRVVIITSRTGDVLHDVLTTAYRRYPGLHTMLFPVPVQGEQAAPKMVEAIRAVNYAADSLGGVDLILLVRGGGSLEDLWAFNEETVARAIADSDIPIATGIGHEPDTTIADLVGDLRGPTPTGVTELTIPDAASLRREIDAQAAMLTRDLRRRVEYADSTLHRLLLELNQAMRDRLRRQGAGVDALAQQVVRIEPRHAIAQGWRRVEEAQRQLEQAMHARRRLAVEQTHRLEWRLERASPLLHVQRCGDHVAHLRAKLNLAMAARLAAARQQLDAKIRQLQIVSPQAVLDRGFSITTDAQGNIIRSKIQVGKGDRITTRVADGTFKSTVGEPRQSSLF